VCSRRMLALTALSAGLVTALFAGEASAQVRYPDRDGGRLRYGVALEGGGLFAPRVVDLGTIGLQGQLGVQFDHLLAVYAAPNIDFVSGWRQEGVQMGGALMVDFTLLHVFTVGIGPDIAGFVASGGGETSGGILYGARLHLGVNPIVMIDRDGIRRRGLTIGLDFRLVTGGGAGVVRSMPPEGIDPILASRRAATADLVASPTITIGYQAF
jgi:hypothetical protein